MCLRVGIVDLWIFAVLAMASPRRLGDPIPQELGMVNIMLPPFSAAGDGITDDSDAIQSAFELAGNQFARRHVFFPAGTYLVTRPLVWRSSSYFEMLGEHESASIIRLAAGSSAFQDKEHPVAVISVPHTASDSSHVAVSGGDNVAF